MGSDTCPRLRRNRKSAKCARMRGPFGFVQRPSSIRTRDQFPSPDSLEVANGTITMGVTFHARSADGWCDDDETRIFPYLHPRIRYELGIGPRGRVGTVLLA